MWAMMVGRFMIMADITIVVVANPTIMAKLHTDYAMVMWVTSAYLLAYVVPLLVAGRLGDRVGAKNIYLIGLSVFTAASLWCGLSRTVDMLIAARVVQGIGAALITPQTLSTITQIFPPERRGVALGVRSAVGGVAALVGPLVGGVLVDALDWRWIFFVNVPIGIVGLALGIRLIPVLPTNPERFDLVGVGLSGAGLFLIVFALQHGERVGWVPWIWAMIAAGIAVMVLLVYWESVNTRGALIPMEIFRDRDFALCNLAGVVVCFIGLALVLPVIFFAQKACGLSALRSALVLMPVSIVSALLAPVAGKIIDRSAPRRVLGFGFSVLAIALTWLSMEMSPATPIWRLVAPIIAVGVGMAFVWSPLTTTATRNLPAQVAGVGSGVFTATQQLGTALGSAGMAAFMTSRLTDVMPAHTRVNPPTGPGSPLRAAVQLPDSLREPFSAAMSQSMLLPAFVALLGLVAALFMVGAHPAAISGEPMKAGAND
ncbi:MFS transporter [Mycobacterium montefiorense]|uniref:MFS transporter n=1 Tax=Mycobacterium montefiorense TaxID=154654 RepID=A0AA37PQY5_9MYCO|nr:MFS transporter [Mycobacterium montefiorense]GKU36273.1 MFS transporter [Mycobacterium montefiorense]GKU42840.1 MFS transporter [Mycobacterium montefiorense]GKU46473.1 MFS transporter [Mycobacterium montefiorense]GKU53646.1 MFS transporter [Mycobacterium montefiorense]